MNSTVSLEGFSGGNGNNGDPLNFDVKAYATEAALLAATPKENTIGIITTTAITSWVFSATEPGSPTDGMVWISTGTSSTFEFNALKKNSIQVYPLEAKQYVDGAWKNVSANIYKNGTWVAWIPAGALYWQGKEFSSITGGWTKSVYVDASAGYTAGVMTKNDESLTLKANSGSGNRENVKCSSSLKVSMDNAKTLNINVIERKGNANSGFLGVHFWISKSTDNAESSDESTVVATTGITKTGVFSIDVSKVTGSYYVKVECYNALCTFDKIWTD